MRASQITPVLAGISRVRKILRPHTSFHFVSRSSIGEQKCKNGIELGSMKYQLSPRLFLGKILDLEYVILVHEAGVPEAPLLASAVKDSICHSKSFERDYDVNMHIMYITQSRSVRNCTVLIAVVVISH